MVLQNFLLETLAPQVMGLIAPYLRAVELRQGQVLAEAHEPIHHVYFPHSGIVSYVVEMSDGSFIETAMVGRDGVVGGIQALDEKVSPNKIMVQGAGEASVIDADRMRQLVAEHPALRVLLAKYEQFFIAQAQQSVGCNACHGVGPRMCRWLLRMNDLVGTEISITQEFMAQMMGVRRTSVSLVAGQLQDQGLIKYKRGHVRIENVEKLEKAACECHGAVREHYKKIVAHRVPRIHDEKPAHSNGHGKSLSPL